MFVITTIDHICHNYIPNICANDYYMLLSLQSPYGTVTTTPVHMLEEHVNYANKTYCIDII